MKLKHRLIYLALIPVCLVLAVVAAKAMEADTTMDHP